MWLLSRLRNDGDSCAAFLQIKHRIRSVSLAKECLLWLQFDDRSAKPGVCKKGGGIELGLNFLFQKSYLFAGILPVGERFVFSS